MRNFYCFLVLPALIPLGCALGPSEPKEFYYEYSGTVEETGEPCSTGRKVFEEKGKYCDTLINHESNNFCAMETRLMVANKNCSDVLEPAQLLPPQPPTPPVATTPAPIEPKPEAPVTNEPTATAPSATPTPTGPAPTPEPTPQSTPEPAPTPQPPPVEPDPTPEPQPTPDTRPYNDLDMRRALRYFQPLRTQDQRRLLYPGSDARDKAMEFARDRLNLTQFKKYHRYLAPLRNRATGQWVYFGQMAVQVAEQLTGRDWRLGDDRRFFKTHQSFERLHHQSTGNWLFPGAKAVELAAACLATPNFDLREFERTYRRYRLSASGGQWLYPGKEAVRKTFNALQIDIDVDEY